MYFATTVCTPRKIGNIFAFFVFFRPTQKIGPDGPKWGQEDFFPTNPDTADILGRTDLDFENFYFWDFFGSQISGLGPSWAQARNFGPNKNTKNTILKIKIRSAQNVDKVWISRKKILLAPFGPIWAHFLRGPEKSKTSKKNAIFLGGPMGLSFQGPYNCLELGRHACHRPWQTLNL